MRTRPPSAILIDPIEGKASYVPILQGIRPEHFFGRHLRARSFKYTRMQALGLEWCGDTIVTIDRLNHDAAYLIRGTWQLFGFGFEGRALILRMTTDGIAGAGCRLQDLKH